MQISVAERVQQTEEYYFSKKLQEIAHLNNKGHDVINLGIGSPDLPPHPEVIAELQRVSELPNSHGYQGYRGIPALRQAMSDWYKNYYSVHLSAEKEILPLIGSKEGVVHICMTYLQEGDQALIPNPGYPAYASAVKLSGAEALPYTLDAKQNWLPDLEELEKQDLSKVKLMWVNYPHMPTGSRANSSFFEKLIAFGRKNNILICHDNPYSFILSEHPISLMQVPDAKDVAIELNSLSKCANMAGWRLGMLVGSEDRINEILRFKSNMDSGMFLGIQMAAIKALYLGQEWYSQLNEIYRKRREKVYEILNVLGGKYQKDQSGLFVWAEVPQNYKNGYEVTDDVLDKARVFITPGGIFGSAGDPYIRISLCANDDILDEALQRIQKTIK